LAAMYYLDATDRLTRPLQKQLLGGMLAVLIVILVFSNWAGSTL